MTYRAFSQSFDGVLVPASNETINSMSKQIEIVQSDSRQQAESSANNRIEEYEENGFELVDQEVALGRGGVTLLLVFETGE